MNERLLSWVRRLALCAVLIVPVGIGARLPVLAGTEAVASARQECVVYITRTGSRYHKYDCRYLRRSRIPVSKADAIKAGYTPCKVCGGSDC